MIITKQPSQLYSLSLLELGERFSHYLLRAMIVLYMIKVLRFSHELAYGVFAVFSSMFYLSPLFGGLIADRWLGAPRAVMLGGTVMCGAYLLLAVTIAERYLYFALALLIVGGGLFMPNIIRLVGQLYEGNDVRRESGFSIFYAAINVGAFLSTLVASLIVTSYDWHWGFLAASISMALALVFYFRLNLIHVSVKSFLSFIYSLITLVLTSWFFSKLLCYPNLAIVLVFVSGNAFLIYTFNRSASVAASQRQALTACLYLILFSILFEAMFQQSAMSMTMFVDTQVYKDIVGWKIPAVLSQALNPLFIVMLVPILSALWFYLGKKNINPSVPTKFAMGILLGGISFAIFPFIMLHNESGQIHYGWIIFSYFLQSCGELLVSPIGLSLLTEKAPTQFAGMMVGVWYFSLAIGQALAGVVSHMTVVTSYVEVFGIAGLLVVFTSLSLFILVPKFNKMLSH